MTQGFGDAKRKNKLDSRDIFFKKEKLEYNFRPAVITPYYKEDLGLIERCHIFVQYLEKRSICQYIANT